MEVFPKFIIEDGCLIIQKATYHRDIATNKDKVIGGGWFLFSQTNNTFTFYGQSDQFGRASFEDIKKAVEEGKVFTGRRNRRNITLEHNFEYCYELNSERVELKVKKPHGTILEQLTGLWNFIQSQRNIVIKHREESKSNVTTQFYTLFSNTLTDIMDEVSGLVKLNTKERECVAFFVYTHGKDRTLASETIIIPEHIMEQSRSNDESEALSGYCDMIIGQKYNGLESQQYSIHTYYRDKQKEN